MANWGVSAALALLLSFSEYLGKTKRFKENTIIDFLISFLSKLNKNN
jgi:hypothetical protein